VKSLFELAVKNESMRQTEILEAYAAHYKKTKKWLSSDHAGKTIQELVNLACDELEKEGIDLSNAHVSSVVEKLIMMVSVKFEISIEYKEVLEALRSVESTHEMYNELKITNKTVEHSLLKTIEKLKKKLETMLSND
jgi:hypothetical protein